MSEEKSMWDEAALNLLHEAARIIQSSDRVEVWSAKAELWLSFYESFAGDPECPECGAHKGEMCRTPRGVKRWHHSRRVVAP
jgi:hypothetical protein